MKFKITFLIIAVALLIGQVNAVANVYITPPNKTTIQDETVELNVIIDSQGTEIAGAQTNIEYNKTTIKVNSVSEGNLFRQNGASTFFNAGTINNSRGTVINTFAAIIGNKNITTGGTFIVINMTAIGVPGTSFINLTNVKISDPNGTMVSLNTTNGTVNINAPPRGYDTDGDNYISRSEVMVAIASYFTTSGINIEDIFGVVWDYFRQTYIG